MRKLLVVIPLLSVLCAGCFAFDFVKPTELPKLNNMTVGRVVQGPHAGRAVGVSVTSLERPDGRLLEVRGRPAVRVTAVDGVHYLFKSPIKAKIEGSRMVIQSSNRPRTIFRLQDIDKVAVRRVSGWTVFWAVFGGLAGGAVISVLACIPLML